MFNLIYQGKFGDTVAVDNPKLEAYKHMAYVRMLGIRTGLIIRDGSYTVQGEYITGKKTSDITFEQAKPDHEEQRAIRRDTINYFIHQSALHGFTASIRFAVREYERLQFGYELQTYKDFQS